MKINFCWDLLQKFPLDKLHHEVWDEGPCAKAKTQEGHHEAGRGLRLFPPDHLRAGDHADGTNVAIGETEQQHDDDVGNITLKSNESESSFGWPDVAEKEEGDENKPEKSQNDNHKIINMFKDKPGDGEEKGDEAADLARFGPLDESSKEPAEIVTNIEEKKAGNGDIEGGRPGRLLG